jgi:transposase
MLWGCFSATGRPVRIEGTMNRAKYREILDENLLEDLRLGLMFTFQQDNDPKHTTKTTQEWLRDKSLNVLEWPSQSPDLNPIEHLWRDLKIAVQHRSQSNLTEPERIYIENGRNTPNTGVISL